MTLNAEPESNEEDPPVVPAGGIGLVAIDLDGTLLNDKKQVSKRTVRALHGLRERGVHVVIASARPPRSVRQVHEILKLDTWTINYNGALIWDPVRSSAVFHKPMEPQIVLSMARLARSIYPDCLVSCEVMDQWFTDRAEQTYTTETGRLFTPNLIAPLESFCNQPITKLMILGSVDTMNGLTRAFKAHHAEIAVVRSDPELIQIMHREVSKASALKHVASQYGVPMSRVMAIGDALNDVPMLEAAGVSIAMDNAHPSVKNVADWIAPTNNDHGVHAALVRYGLCPPR